MLKSRLCNYKDTYLFVKRTISITNPAGAGNIANSEDRKVVFKTCAPFTDCINERNNTQVDNAKDIDVVIPMYNLIEYSDNYLKTSRSLWQ